MYYGATMRYGRYEPHADIGGEMKVWSKRIVFFSMAFVLMSGFCLAEVLTYQFEASPSWRNVLAGEQVVALGNKLGDITGTLSYDTEAIRTNEGAWKYIFKDGVPTQVPADPQYAWNELSFVTSNGYSFSGPSGKITLQDGVGSLNFFSARLEDLSYTIDDVTITGLTLQLGSTSGEALNSGQIDALQLDLFDSVSISVRYSFTDENRYIYYTLNDIGLVDAAPVPEPGTFALLGIGLGILGVGVARGKKRT